MHAAVARAREPVDVGLLQARVVERAAERLRFEHDAAQVGRDRPVGETDTHDTHVPIHGAGT